MKLTYIRWSMTVIQTGAVTLVTDPVFRVAGLRQAPSAFTRKHLPPPDLVFVSHLHLDHFEPSTLKRLPPTTPVWLPAAAVPRVARLGRQEVRGLEAWEAVDWRGLRLTAVPAVHGGGELGLVIEGDRTVYFAGDTSLDRDLFRTIGQRWRLDAVLLPVGDLRVLGLPVGHIGPKQAVHALRVLGEPRVVVPTHYSGMTLRPFMSFAGTPRKLAAALDQGEVGSLLGTTRPLETVEI